MKESPKKFFLRTYGCQMNELDSEVMAGILQKRGLERTEEESEADLLLYNTCWVRELAARKVMGKLGKLGTSPKKNAIIGVTGCMANAKGGKLFEKLPHLDFVLGTNNIQDLNAVLDEVLLGKQAVRVDPLFKEELDYEGAQRENGLKAYVSIIRGCDKFCTYCCVPYTRGKEVSRPAASIVSEVKKLAEQGFKEICLLGQNVNSYGKDQPEWNIRFHDLLCLLDQIPGIERIRFMTSHPVDITRELMEAIRDLPSVCEFVHFPLQAGSNRILKKMHRIYTKEQYFEKVALLREIVPDVHLGTDMIVGFPTETEEEFLETYEAMEEIEYSTAFLFAYSPRSGTPAKRWVDDVKEEVKEDRLHRLLRLHNRIVTKQRNQALGSSVEVLVDKVAKDPLYLRGRTRGWVQCIFPGDPSLIGTLQTIKIESFSHQTLIGTLQSCEFKSGAKGIPMFAGSSTSALPKICL
ncbi:MAG: tRNA (N6-isopentenyl adenosine(37)-C2)-methylthiotransferase MiaB [Verrucomicrobia bacterium]|nr:tRNA (N6-isopentenyl adenosine(37)-C2)-methylthiotransferase MiaB [Verrucomicrobiota bacterium]